MTKVSVRIPSINCDPRLPKAIESVITQKRVNFDLVIVDNSTDERSWEKTRILADKYNIPTVHNPTPGLAENWNYCIETAMQDYLLILHMDDELLPGMLEKSVAFLDDNPQAGMVHTDVYDLTADGRILTRTTQDRPFLNAGAEAVMKILTNNNLACSSVMVRRECYQKLGLFLTGNPSPDLEMWARIGKNYAIGHLAEPLVKVSLHPDSSGPKLLLSMTPEEIEAQWTRLFERMLSYLPESERVVGEKAMHNQLAGDLASAGGKAWRLGRWQQGQRFFNLARHQSSLGAWWVVYLKAVLKIPFHRARRPKYSTAEPGGTQVHEPTRRDLP